MQKFRKPTQGKSYAPKRDFTPPKAAPAAGKPAYGKPAPGKPAYGKPAYGKPAQAPGTQGTPGTPVAPGTPDKPSYGKPATGKPYGKPATPVAPSSYAKPVQAPGKPAYGKPAYGKPAQAPGTQGRPSYGKPATPVAPSSYAKPVQAPEWPAYAKPAYRKAAPVPESPAATAVTPSSAGPARVPGRPAFRRPDPLKGPPAFKRAAPPSRPSRPFKQQKTGDNPRLVALNTLQDVTRSDAYATLALGQRLREAKLDQRDRDFVTELAYGTLERRIALDYLIDLKLERPDVECLVRDILRMGAYQILYLDRVPDSAAVDESVKLARILDRGPFTGLVNGVLRAIARDKETGLPWPKREDGPAKYLSVYHSLPLWIVGRLIAAYGFDEAEAMAAYRPEERSVTVRRTAEKLAPAAFEALMTEKGWAWKPALLENAYYVSGIGDVGLDKDFQTGKYSVQGESSMLAAAAVAPKRGATVLDACAAPGGKTACLAERMGGTGRVYAWDVHEHRVDLIRGMVTRLRLDSVRPAVRDATVVKEDLALTMDAALIDAPCSGLGVMLNKPDVKYRHTEETVASLCETQTKLLDACAAYVKPGGALVYSTCSILPDENGDRVDAFLKAHPEFSEDAEGLAAALPAFLRGRAVGGRLQLFAHRDGMDGFFIARLKKARA